MIVAMTEMFKMQTKRYKIYTKMEDKVLPVLDRLLDLYPLAEPFIDRALKVAEKAAPLVLKKLDENMEAAVAGLMEQFDSIDILAGWDCDDLTEAGPQLKQFAKHLQIAKTVAEDKFPERAKVLYNAMVKAVEETTFDGVGATTLKAYLLIQIKDIYEKALKEE
jgi:hypothetical protein